MTLVELSACARPATRGPAAPLRGRARVADADGRADRGAFFASVHGTRNQLLVTDRVWLQRFTGGGSAPDGLDAILHERLDDLDAARIDEDARSSATSAASTGPRSTA